MVKSNIVDFLINDKDIIISKLVIPVILTILASVISTIRLQYLNLHEKNQYLNLLKINYPSVEAVINTVKKYKKVSQVYFIYILLLGLFLGGSCCLLLMNFIPYFDQNGARPFHDPNSIHPFYSIFSDCLLYPVLINLLVYLVCCELIKSKNPSTENDNDFHKLRDSQILSYFSFWLSMGFISGTYVLGIIFLYIETTNNINFGQSRYYLAQFRWAYNEKFALIFTIIVSLLVILLSFNIFVDLYKKIKQFPKNVIDPIINYHECNFPNLIIKTDSGEFKGQLKDFRDKHLVTLYEENVLHFVAWNKIETMEVIDINKNKCTFHDKLMKKNQSM